MSQIPEFIIKFGIKWRNIIDHFTELPPPRVLNSPRNLFLWIAPELSDDQLNRLVECGDCLTYKSPSAKSIEEFFDKFLIRKENMTTEIDINPPEEGSEQEIDSRIGWCVVYPSGWYLTYGHGYRLMSAGCATISPTREAAQQDLDEAIKDDKFFADGKVVKAYIPFIAQLEGEIYCLKKANRFSPDKLFDLQTVLEDALDLIKS
jgi:hypothetical protein